MTVPFAAVVTPDSLVFTAPSGKTFTVSSGDLYFDQAKALIKQIGAHRSQGIALDDLLITELVDALVTLVTPAQALIQQSDGRVTVQHGVVYYGSTPLHSALTERILWGLSEGFNMNPYVAFLENVMQNPSNRAVTELYQFVERNKMGITDDGHILGYKRVRGDFMDIHSGTMDNSPGQIVTMPRNQVNDNPNETCSNGLHFCSQSYLPHYGAGGGNKIVIVKVNPADVVSVPVDYDAAKVRACRYEVLSEYEGSDKDDLLATKAVFNSLGFRDGGYDWRDNVGVEVLHDFKEGDRVICIDNEGVEFELDEDAIYVIDSINEDGEIRLKDFEREDEWFCASRFEILGDDPDGEDDDDRYDDEEEEEDFLLGDFPEPDPDVEDWGGVTDTIGAAIREELSTQNEPPSPDYDRGYDAGYAKGVIDADDPSVHYAEPSAHSEDQYGNGYVGGWVAAMKAGRSELMTIYPDLDVVINADLPQTEASATEEPMSFDEPTVIETSSVEIPVEQSPEASVIVPLMPEREIHIPPVEPLHEPPTTKVAGLVFDPITGRFKTT